MDSAPVVLRVRTLPFWRNVRTVALVLTVAVVAGTAIEA